MAGTGRMIGWMYDDRNWYGTGWDCGRRQGTMVGDNACTKADRWGWVYEWQVSNNSRYN